MVLGGGGSCRARGIRLTAGRRVVSEYASRAPLTGAPVGRLTCLHGLQGCKCCCSPSPSGPLIYICYILGGERGPASVSKF